MEFSPGEVIIIGYTNNNQIKEFEKRLRNSVVLVKNQPYNTLDPFYWNDAKLAGKVVVALKEMHALPKDQTPDLDDFIEADSMLLTAALIVACHQDKATILKKRLGTEMRFGYKKTIDLEELYFPLLLPSS